MNSSIGARLGRKWLILWVVLLAFNIFPIYVAGMSIWRFGPSYIGVGCALMIFILVVGLVRMKPLAFDVLPFLFTGSTLLSLGLFYRSFDGGKEDWPGMELRIVLAITWIAICLAFAHLSTLLADRIQSVLLDMEMRGKNS